MFTIKRAKPSRARIVAATTNSASSSSSLSAVATLVPGSERSSSSDIVSPSRLIGRVPETVRLAARCEMPTLDAMKSVLKRERAEYVELGMIRACGSDEDDSDDQVKRKYSRSEPIVLKPMLAAPVSELSSITFTEDEPYVYEEKYDGERMLCFIRDCDDYDAKFYSRAMKPLSFSFKIPLAPNHANCILDGELVFLNDDSELVPICDTGDRRLLRKQYRVFDVQMIDGRYVHDLPLRERKRLLAELLIPSRNVTVAPFHRVLDLETLTRAFEATVDGDGEGLILKRLNEPYASGRRRWIKLKSLHINGRKLEFDLYANRMLRDKNNILNVLECGYYDEEDAFVRVCSVSSGIDAKNRTRLRRISRDGAFLPRELIVTIIADKVTRHGSLRHPVFRRIRTDLESIDAEQLDSRLGRASKVASHCSQYINAHD